MLIAGWVCVYVETGGTTDAFRDARHMAQQGSVGWRSKVRSVENPLGQEFHTNFQPLQTGGGGGVEA